MRNDDDSNIIWLDGLAGQVLTDEQARNQQRLAEYHRKRDAAQASLARSLRRLDPRFLDEPLPPRTRSQCLLARFRRVAFTLRVMTIRRKLRGR